MPRGDKDKYTDKQIRQAEHIEESYEERGLSEEEAERRAWATVNKQDGGGKQSGSGRKQPGSPKAEESVDDAGKSGAKSKTSAKSSSSNKS